MAESRAQAGPAALLLASGLLLAGPGAAHPEDTCQTRDGGALVAEVRIFEIRRLSSDFSPIAGLSFRVNSDGVRVPASDWLATLARRIPEAYFAQLLTLGPVAAGGGEDWEAAVRGDRRAVRIRLSPVDATGAEGRIPERFDVEMALVAERGPVWTVRREAAVEPGATLIVSGRDFELSATDYLSWFRAPPDLETRGRLYQRLRRHSIFLALAVTFRAAEAAAQEPPVRLTAPPDPRLLDLETSLVGPAEGSVRLRVTINGEGAPIHTEVLATTFPEVTPRVLGIVSGWRFPEAAGKVGRLAFPIASR